MLYFVVCLRLLNSIEVLSVEKMECFHLLHTSPVFSLLSFFYAGSLSLSLFSRFLWCYYIFSQMLASFTLNIWRFMNKKWVRIVCNFSLYFFFVRIMFAFNLHPCVYFHYTKLNFFKSFQMMILFHMFSSFEKCFSCKNFFLAC